MKVVSFALTGRNPVFHESFDSTRSGDPAWRAANVAQAEAEAVQSLLLGYTLTLPNTYAFDSYAVLKVAQAVLLARRDVLAELPRTSAHAAGRQRLDDAVPLRLSWYAGQQDKPGFLQACARQLRNIHPHPDPDQARRFVLSGWASIDQQETKRHQLADYLVANGGTKKPVWLGEDEHADARFMLEALGELVRATEGQTLPAHQATKGTDLIHYLQEFRRRGAADGGRSLTDYAERKNCEPDVLHALWRHIDAELETNGKKLESRSWVHETPLDSVAPSLVDWRRELVDTLYNARLADSAHAGDAFLSSVPRATYFDQLATINALAVDIVATVRQEAGAGTDSAPPILGGDFSASEHIREADDGALRALFRAFWEITADDERQRAWDASCRRVDQLLRRRPADEGRRAIWAARPEGLAWPGRVKKAWGQHVQLLSAQLPDIEDQDGALTLSRGDHRYQQRPRDEDAQPLAAAEVGPVRAAGRYLAILGGRAG